MRTSFGADLAKFAKKCGVTQEQALRGIVIELFSSVILDTPVDTGRARGNWITSVNSFPRSVVDRVGAAAATADVSSSVFGMGDTIYLTNNLPYIQRLEYEGWSKQAPDGMVRKNMARIEGIVSRAVKGAKA